MARRLIVVYLSVILILQVISVLYVDKPVQASPEPIPSPQVTNGIIDLSSWDFDGLGAVSLNGQWEFYWKELLTPKDLASRPTLSSPGTIHVPGVWGSQSWNGMKLTNKGHGTYKLTVLLPENSSNSRYGIYMPSVATAYRLWIDGQLEESNGTVGISYETMVPKNYSKTVYVSPKAGRLELVIQVSNYVQRKGGLWEPIKLGLAKQITKEREENVIYEVAVASALIMIGLYHLGLFCFGRTEWTTVYFAVFCIFIALRTLLLGETLLINIFPEIGWELAVKMEYLSVYFGITIFGLFMYKQFQQEMSRVITKWILAISCVFSLLVVLTPAYVYTETMQFFELFLFSSSLYLMYVLISALRRNREGAVIHMFGWLFFLAAIINDVLYYNHIVFTGDLIPIGLLLFVLSQALVMAGRFHSAFRHVARLSGELKEANATLEIKVKERTWALEKSNERLQEANEYLRLSELSRRELVSNISHDLGTPMTSIRAYLQGMLDGVIRSDDRKYLQVIFDKVIYINRLIEDLFDLSKLGAGRTNLELKVEPVVGWLQEIFRKFELDVQSKGLSFKLELVNDGAEDNGQLNTYLDKRVRIDEGRMQQVFTNLIGNAIRHTAQGGITVRAEISGQELNVSISDTGSGMDSSMLPYVFDRFFKGNKSRNSKSGEGTGLGLAIVKAIVEAHGGRVWVHSTLQEGSSFTFSLPFHEDEHNRQKGYEGQ
jgi:signal transduction histidine kinase